MLDQITKYLLLKVIIKSALSLFFLEFLQCMDVAAIFVMYLLVAITTPAHLWHCGTCRRLNPGT